MNFSVQLYASLTCEEPAFLQITYHYVYYLKYTKLKIFFGHHNWAPKLVYQPLNSSGFVYEIDKDKRNKDLSSYKILVLL